MKTILKQLLLLCAVTLSMPTTDSFAAERRGSGGKSQAQTQSESDSAASPKPKAVGLSAVQNITASQTAITGLIELDPMSSLQGFFSMASTSPFQISGALAYKRTIHGGPATGIHLGGGLGLGSTDVGAGSSFFIYMSGIAGLHLPFPSVPNVSIHLDAGPSFQIHSGDSANFAIGGMSPLLGVSILYYL